MAKTLKQVDQPLISAIYTALGTTPPADRALARIVITLEPGRPVNIQENTIPLVDSSDEEPVAETKTDAEDSTKDA